MSPTHSCYWNRLFGDKNFDASQKNLSIRGKLLKTLIVVNVDVRNAKVLPAFCLYRSASSYERNKTALIKVMEP